MNTENIILVGAVWAVLLLVLLVLREFLRVLRVRSQVRIMPVLDRLIVVMIVAFALAAVVRVGSLITGPVASEPSGSPLASNVTGALSPSPTSDGSPAAASPTPGRTPRTSPRPTTTPKASTTPTPVPTPQPTPVPTPIPTPVPTPGATPTPALPSATPSAPPVDAGALELSRVFRVYELHDGIVSGFHDVHASAASSARSTAPRDYPFPTLSDPNGTVRLAQILTGPYAGAYVAPHDPGVKYTPTP